MSLYDGPFWLVLFALSALSVALACGGHVLFRRLVPYKSLVAHNDVAGFTIAVIGVIYAVLLAFVVIVVWEQYNDSDSRYGDEVAAMADLDAYARLLPLREGDTLRSMVRHYVRLMIVEEWPAMLGGGESRAATQVLADIGATIESYHARNGQETMVQLRLLEELRAASDDRQRRLSDNQNTLPLVMWVALIAGAAVTIGFGYLFGVQNFRAQLAMTASVALLIAFSFTILIELDYPFRRDSAIPVDRWQFLQHSLGRLSAR